MTWDRSIQARSSCTAPSSTSHGNRSKSPTVSGILSPAQQWNLTTKIQAGMMLDSRKGGKTNNNLNCLPEPPSEDCLTSDDPHSRASWGLQGFMDSNNNTSLSFPGSQSRWKPWNPGGHSPLGPSGFDETCLIQDKSINEGSFIAYWLGIQK